MTLGSVELWRPVPDFPGYEVSDQGQVWSDHSRRLLAGRVNDKGYRLVSMSRPGERPREHRVHRLVLLAFVGPCPEGQEGRHLDGDPANNALANLAWGTPVENADDSRRLGRGNPGATHCPNNHPYDDENTRWTDGERYCRACRREHARRYRGGPQWGRCRSGHPRAEDGSCPTCLDLLVEFRQAFPGA